MYVSICHKRLFSPVALSDKGHSSKTSGLRQLCYYKRDLIGPDRRPSNCRSSNEAVCDRLFGHRPHLTVKGKLTHEDGPSHPWKLEQRESLWGFGNRQQLTKTRSLWRTSLDQVKAALETERPDSSWQSLQLDSGELFAADLSLRCLRQHEIPPGPFRPELAESHQHTTKPTNVA